MNTVTRICTFAALAAICLTATSSASLAYELKAFKGKSGKARLSDFVPRLEESENNTNKFFAEQYSFVSSFKNDAEFWFQLVLSNMGLSNGRAALMVHYKPDGKDKIKSHEQFEQGDWSYSVEGDKLVFKLGGNTLSGSVDGWSGHFSNEEFDADFTVENGPSAWRPGGGVVEYGKKSSYYDITILTPRGSIEVDAVVKNGEGSAKLSGTAYGDHSIINLPPNKQARRWIKMRVIRGSYTLILNTLESSEEYEGRWVGYFMIASNSRVVVTVVNPTMVLDEFERDSKSGYEIPKLVVLSGGDGADQFEGAIEATKLRSREDKLEGLSSLEKAIVSKFAQPVSFTYKSEYEFKFTKSGKEKTYDGRGRYIFEQVTK